MSDPATCQHPATFFWPLTVSAVGTYGCDACMECGAGQPPFTKGALHPVPGSWRAIPWETRMADFKNRRRMHLKIYFSDSPSPIEVENVCHMGTEGGLLRIITSGSEGGGETQWWPLCNVFNIRLLGTAEVA